MDLFLKCLLGICILAIGFVLILGYERFIQNSNIRTVNGQVYSKEIEIRSSYNAATITNIFRRVKVVNVIADKNYEVVVNSEFYNSVDRDDLVILQIVTGNVTGMDHVVDITLNK